MYSPAKEELSRYWRYTGRMPPVSEWNLLGFLEPVTPWLGECFYPLRGSHTVERYLSEFKCRS